MQNAAIRFWSALDCCASQSAYAFGSSDGKAYVVAANEWTSLYRIATGGLWPDLTVILDIDIRTGLARSRRRNAVAGLDEGRFEALDLGFHERVRQSYRDQAARWPERYAVIDAGRAEAEVQQNVLDRVLEAVGRHG